MTLRSVRSRSKEINYWSSFVDVMATLTLVLIFLLSLFLCFQFLLSREMYNRDSTLSLLHDQLLEISEFLGLDLPPDQKIEEQLLAVRGEVFRIKEEKDHFHALAHKQNVQHAKDLSAVQEILATEKNVSKSYAKDVQRLQKQIHSLRTSISSLSKALASAEKQVDESAHIIKDLGKRLNLALAKKVEELSQYRSNFFGKMRDVLKEHPNIQVVGDRFIFQSELLFDSGSAHLRPEGLKELDTVSKIILKLEKEIPEDIDWILRIDGHTDNRPIDSEKFSSNWELSTARALSVVHHLIAQGISPMRLAATGFGEHRPLVKNAKKDAESLRKNRRIEIKLTAN